MGISDRKLRRELIRRGASRRQLRRLERKLGIRRRNPLAKLLLNLILWAAVLVAIYVFFVFMTLPSLDKLINETREPVITFVDRDGFEIQSRNQIMGDPVSHANLPRHVWMAIIAIEDHRFFQHNGIDPRGITRATINNITGRRSLQGGSTITQQTAKNIFLTPSRTVHRKIQELMIALWLEQRFTKPQILDLYMNRVSLSRGMRGIDAAARDIFHKRASELTIAESAQIAAMLKAPTTFSPIRHPERNMARARIVLSKMLKHNAITPEQHAQALTELRPPPPSAPRDNRNDMRYWADFVMIEVTSRLGTKIEDDIFVWTTLDVGLQTKAANTVRERVGNYQGAVVAINRDGEILAMVGGRNYAESQFNRATAPRQPASAFKTAAFLVALENGRTPGDIVEDSPFSIGDFNPTNMNERYFGMIPLSEAFARSVNSVPLRIAAEFGLDSVLSMAARLGVGSRLRRDFSTVLGASEMTLLDLTTMYATIWNNGFSMRPFAITKITTAGGTILYERQPNDSFKLLKDTTVQQMTQLLADVTRTGTGRRANVPGVTIGGKTGTSNAHRDAWFIGATKDMTMGVWMGNDNFTPMNRITGGTIPAEIFRAIVTK